MLLTKTNVGRVAELLQLVLGTDPYAMVVGDAGYEEGELQALTGLRLDAGGAMEIVQEEGAVRLIVHGVPWEWNCATRADDDGHDDYGYDLPDFTFREGWVLVTDCSSEGNRRYTVFVPGITAYAEESE